jgi:toxin-antitoxin system PIN domain toxin
LNLLLYAINEDAPHHRRALDFWETAINGDEPVGLAWTVLLGFLRLATRPGVFPRPLTLEEAIDCVDAWLAHPNSTLAQETEEHWRVLKTLVEGAGTAGNLTSDAHLAAIAIGRGATLVSFDSDFSRFPGLRRENPIGGESRHAK